MHLCRRVCTCIQTNSFLVLFFLIAFICQKTPAKPEARHVAPDSRLCLFKKLSYMKALFVYKELS